MLPVCSGPPLRNQHKVFVSVPDWWPRYSAMRLLYIQTPPAFSYVTAIYKNCRDYKGRIKVIARTENALITMVCFFAACWNGNSSHSFGLIQFEHHCDGIVVPLPTGVFKDVAVLGLYEVIQLAAYDQVLCLLALLRSQEMVWSPYGGEDPPCFVYDFKTWHVFDVPPLLANKRSKRGSAVIVDVPSHEARRLQEKQFSSITSCKIEWLELC